MNNFRSLILPVMAFGIAVSFASCEKEDTAKVDETTSIYTLTIRPHSNEDRYGEEEDKDVIQGRYEDSNFDSIENANIDLLESSDSSITDSDVTDVNGKFEVSAVSGSYLFRINEGSNTPHYTEIFELIKDVQITIQRQ